MSDLSAALLITLSIVVFIGIPIAFHQLIPYFVVASVVGYLFAGVYYMLESW